MAKPVEDAREAEEYLQTLLDAMGDIGPKVERVSEEMAEDRIRYEIAKIPGEKQQGGLWSIHTTLKEHGVPAAVRLHLVSAVVNLSLIAAQRRSTAGTA
jgi:hypothetical protein